MEVVRNILFTAVVSTLFGDSSLPQTQQEIKHFQKHFFQFDGDFEHGAKLPEFLLKEWAKSKHFLLRWFCEVLQKNSSANIKEETLLQSMVDSLEGDCAPNYSIMLLWASLANAVPITFWTLAFVLRNQAIKKDVQKEVDEVLGPYLKDGGEGPKRSHTQLRRCQADLAVNWYKLSWCPFFCFGVLPVKFSQIQMK